MANNEPISAKPIKTTLLDTAIFYAVEDGVGYQISKADLKTIMAPAAAAVAFDVLHVRDEKANNVAGGTASATTWNQRDLNTVMTNTITGASLASDQITLPAGTYDIVARAPVHESNRHKLRWRNTTDGTTTLIGSSGYVAAADTMVGLSFVKGRFTIAAEKVFELQHYTEAAKATNGLGIETNASVVEVYADVLITKVP